MDNEESSKYFWFARIPILAVLYFISSKEKKLIYFAGLLFYQLASVFFFTGNPNYFLFGTLSSVLFKVCLVLLIFTLVTVKNRTAIGLAILPFFVLYLYVIELVVDSLGDTYYIWIINALLTSFIGGVAIVYYLNDSDEKGAWLLISAILFIVQIAAFFINKFYVKNEGIYQMIILSYGISHFTFYKFLILKENELF
ncbi:lysoplasmalogenase family protein [Flavobacterium suncheonense]|uniref:YhhN-like protein n=1 Tax=Flavobacterium suncheonense GH29-5 = DSM 17707 TaxID=1121899 RepID=A0A0A2M8L2_9FLAO|nr:lysoplasmalogenase family protein [Flavobacterium suncheonense]KGO89017.1 hypothetical protein Q764_10465 [Flavobacterium suncheonense GH29-5 = DSM 17707]